MKWTEQEARNYFSPDVTWGRRSANWEPAQALIAALDAERTKTTELLAALDLAIADTDDAERRLDEAVKRNAKLERVATAADWVLSNRGRVGVTSNTALDQLTAALAALEETK